MKNIIKFGLVMSMFLIIFVSGCVQKEKPIEIIVIPLLVKEYANFNTTLEYWEWYNQISHDDQLTEAQKHQMLDEVKGKYVIWEGIIENVYQESWAGTGAIMLKNPAGCLFCPSFYLDDLQNVDRNQLISFNKSDTIRFEGMLCGDYELRNVTIIREGSK